MSFDVSKTNAKAAFELANSNKNTRHEQVASERFFRAEKALQNAVENAIKLGFLKTLRIEILTPYQDEYPSHWLNVSNREEFIEKLIKPYEDGGFDVYVEIYQKYYSPVVCITIGWNPDGMAFNPHSDWVLYER